MHLLSPHPQPPPLLTSPPGVYLLTTGEPAQARGHRPEPTACSRAHSLHCALCGFRLMNSRLHLSLEHRKEQLHLPEHPLCSHYAFLPPPPQPLATADLFPASLVLPSPEGPVVRIVRRVAFSDWPLPPSPMHVSFLCVFS